MSKQKKAKHTPNASSGKPQDVDSQSTLDEAKRCPVLPNHKYLQDPAAVSDRCRVIRKNPYLQERAAGPPDEHWTWEELTDPKGEKVEGWSPDDTVPATGPLCPFPPEKEEASGDSLLDALLREDDPLLDVLNNWSESDEDRRRRVYSRGFNRALGMREKKPSLPRVPDYTGNPEVDEKNLRQWCIDAEPDKPGLDGNTHGPDFRSVRWGGETYTFSPNQAACVRQWWEAMENGTPDVGGDTVLASSDIDSKRIQDVFRDHPALGVMIVPGATKGAYRIAPKKD